MKHRLKKLSAIFLVLAIAVVSLAACSGGKKDTNTVTIGTLDLVNGDLIAQYEDWYTKELGVDVKIIRFDSGKDINSAIASGGIDIGQEGTSPAALAISNDIDIKVFWIGDVIGSAETLVAKKDSGIQTIQDLKGKKVATPFASTAHYSLLNALKNAGVAETDVELLDLQPDDIFATWQRGDIDAAYVWYPVLDNLLADGVVVTDSEQLAKEGVVTADVNVVRAEYAEAHPDVVQKFVELQLRANDIINQQPEIAAQDIAKKLEIEEVDAKKQIQSFTYLNADEEIDYLDNSFAEILKNTADFLVEQKSIKSAPDLSEFQSRVTSEYVKAAK
ncbi:MAG: aliphatic sulfonate ABC transporter substrate-binding protein [Clostridia bacterium]|nr:aliphatic sulfonate ABC transporter substrate-binding protein [Clostridia bacterium]